MGFRLKERKDVPQPNGAPSPQINITNIDVMPIQRTGLTLPDWKASLESAESILKYRNGLYDYYETADIHPHVEAVSKKLRDAVSDANWQFVDHEGVPIDEINQVIDSIGFDEMVRHISDTTRWGYSVIEPAIYKNEDDEWNMSCHLVPRKNVRPELGIVTKTPFDETGINIREGLYIKTVMEIGNPDDLGRYKRIVPYVLLMNGAFSDYAEYVEVYGEPVIDAVYDGMDDDGREKLRTAIRARGRGGAIVRPKGTEVTMLSVQGNATGELQDKFIRNCENQISKGILGTTETTQSSSSSGYAQSKTHESVDERSQAAEITYTRRYLNTCFRKILRSAGFDTKGGKFIIEGENNELSKKESFEMYATMTRSKEQGGLGVPVDDDFWYENFGLVKPENYDKLKAAQSQKTESKEPLKPEAPEPSEPEKPKPQASNKELSWMDRFRAFFDSAPAEIGAKESDQDHLTCCGGRLITMSDEPNFNQMAAQVAKEAWAQKGQLYLYPAIFNLNAKALTTGFQTGWKKQDKKIELADVGFVYDVDDPVMLAAFEQNLFKFSAVKAAYQSEEVNKLFRESKSFDEFLRKVDELFGAKNQNYLRTEYATAYATGENAATYYRLMKQIDLFPYWEIRTVLPLPNVRKHHALLHGRIMPAGHEIWQMMWPPFDWNCRCYIVPRLAKEVDETKVAADLMFVQNYLANSPAWEKSRKNGFGANPIMSMQVFSEDQMYHEDSYRVMKKIGGMTADAWKLPKLSESKSHNTNKPTQAGKDYAGRDVIGVNTDGQRTISNPDEVWLEDRVFTYIRHHESGSEVVEAWISSDGNMYYERSSIATESDRRGLLIYTPDE